MNYKKKINTLELVYIALFTALICVVTMCTRIPTFIGYTHLGDSIIFLVSIILGKKGGTIASALGMCLVDILGGYAVWAPFTLIIKGIMGYITGSIAYRKKYNGEDLKNNIFACMVGGVWMVLAYYLANVIITRFIYVKTANFHESLTIALLDVPGNIIEVGVGIVVAIILIKAIKKYKNKI